VAEAPVLADIVDISSLFRRAAATPRTARTRGRLCKALLAACEEQPLDQVSVSGVVCRAGDGRATFCLYYDDLRAGVYRSLLRAGGGGPLGKLLREELRQRGIGELHRRRPPGTGEDLIASAVAGLFTGVLADWVHGRIDACPAQPAGRTGSGGRCSPGTPPPRPGDRCVSRTEHLGRRPPRPSRLKTRRLAPSRRDNHAAARRTTARRSEEPDVAVRAVRGAVQLDRDEAGHMDERVSGLLTAILERNSLVADDLISIWFTATPDLHSDFPAAAARGIGIVDVPLICAQELDIEGAMPRVVRILAHVETYLAKSEITHVYLGATASLRKDIAQ
jgi:chorismate mutase